MNLDPCGSAHDVDDLAVRQDQDRPVGRPHSQGDVMDTSNSLKRDGHSSLERRREPMAARAAAGRERRDTVPLDAHAELVVPTGRASALSILQAEDADRLQDLVPIRYGRMLATPFTFLRGSAAVMAADLAAGPRTDLTVQLCGDAHLSNFGMFSSPERRLVFDVNDFDETLPGPFEWDVKRLAASVVVAGRNNQFDKKTNRKLARATTAAYRETIARASKMNPLDVFYYRLDVEDLSKTLETAKSDRRRLAKTRKKSARKNSLGALGKLTDIVDGRRVIVSNPPLIVAMSDEQRRAEMTQIEAFFGEYRATLPADRGQLMDRYSMTDIARKVVGVGSVGTRCLIACCSNRVTEIHCSSRSRRPPPRCSRRTWRRADSIRRATESSTDNERSRQHRTRWSDGPDTSERMNRPTSTYASSGTVRRPPTSRP